MAVVIRSHVMRLVHASAKRRAWTTPSLSAALLAVMVAVVVVLAWESTIGGPSSTAALDVEFGDEPTGGTTIVDDSPFGLPLRDVAEEPAAGPAGTLAADRPRPTTAARRDGQGPADPAPAPRRDASPPARGTGGGSTSRPTAPAPRRPAPTTTAPTGETPVAPLPVSKPEPVPTPVAPAPQVDATPVVSVDTSTPSVGVGPVAGVSASVDTSGVEATAPLAGSVSVSLG